MKSKNSKCDNGFQFDFIPFSVPTLAQHHTQIEENDGLRHVDIVYLCNSFSPFNIFVNINDGQFAHNSTSYERFSCQLCVCIFVYERLCRSQVL